MDTIYAPSSGLPPAAIAIIRISGPDALVAARALAGDLPVPREARLRTLRDARGGHLDTALVLVFPAPDTATGEDLVELHVHGGRAVVAAVEAALGTQPRLRRAEPGEFTRRALTNGRIDLAEAEGLGDLLSAETELQRRAALAMADGTLSRRVATWRAALLGLAARLEASLDFADEGDVDPVLLATIREEAHAVGADIAAALAVPPVDRLHDGIRVVLAGPPNSGKSTLLSLLLRFYHAQSGTITIDGLPLAEIGDTAFRERVGLVPQDPFLLAASARENIAMGRDISDADIEAAARAAKAHEFICTLENGYDTPLGEGGARLSTGQKQLIAIARALAGKPAILFLDEATSHIDSETEQVVQTALAELRGKVTIIAIAHRLSTIRDADRIVVLNHGRIAEEGRHEELMEIGGGIYQRLYLLQQLSD